METQHLVWAVFGTSITGFFFLLGMIIANNKEVIIELRKINKALVGDYDSSGEYIKGVMPLVHEHVVDIKMIKEKCKEIHKESHV